MYRPMGTAAKTYFTLTLFATFFIAIITYFLLQEKENQLIDKTHLQLHEIAADLERMIDNDLFAAEVTRINALPLSQEQKALQINAWLQPMLMKLSANHPGIGLGIYSKQLERIVAIGPEFRPERLVPVLRPEVVKLYYTQKPEFVKFDNSIGWSGKPIYNLAYPIISKGEFIGHTWASAKTEDILAEIQQSLLIIWLYAGSIWCITLGVIWIAFSNLERGLKRLAAFIRQQEHPDHLNRDFPELYFLTEEIYRLRSNLQQEYQEREKMLQEIARIDRLNSVGDMAASIGHEVRNPLTTVRGYLQLFQRKPQFDSYAGQLCTMIEELDRANAIITEFLSLAKDKPVHMQDGNLNDVILSLYPLLQADAFRRGHEMTINLGSIPNNSFDKGEICQLILNLVRNGLEAMEPSGTVTIQTYTDSNGQICLAIADMGTGISDEIMAKLGMPFVTTKEEGTGLGLPVCYRVANRHMAQLQVVTNEKGTTFTTVFPLRALPPILALPEEPTA